MATHSSILAWRIPMDRGAWWATVHRTAKSATRLKRLTTQCQAFDSLLFHPHSNSSQQHEKTKAQRSHIICLRVSELAVAELSTQLQGQGLLTTVSYPQSWSQNRRQGVLFLSFSLQRSACLTFLLFSSLKKPSQTHCSYSFFTSHEPLKLIMCFEQINKLYVYGFI